MTVTRVPLGHNIGTRDGTLEQDSKLGNAIIEVEKKESLSIVKRPGLKTYETLTAGTALGLFSAGSNLLSIIGTTFYDNGVANATSVDGTSAYNFVWSVDETTVFFKNESAGYVYTIATQAILPLAGTITTSNDAITTINSPTVSLASSNSAIQIGQLVSDSLGYVQAGTYVLAISGNTLTLSQNALETTSATTTQAGTTTAASDVVTLSAPNSSIVVGQQVTDSAGYIPAGTNVVSISGTTLTLSQSANISGSTTLSFFTGTNLTFTTSYPGTTVPGLVFLDGYYVVGTPNGLLYNSNVEDPTTWQAVNYIGVVSAADPLYTIGRTYNYIVTYGGYHIEFFYDAGTSPGSPFLPYQNAVLQFGIAAPHSLVQMDNTLVWMGSSHQKGFQMMAMVGQSPQIISNQYIERVINRCDPSQAYAFSVKTAGHSLYILTMRDIGITLVYDFAQSGWTYWTSTQNNVEIYFQGQFYAKYNNMDLIQHETNGKIYELDPNTYEDDGNPIQVFARTPIVDFGTNARKFFYDIQVIGDKVDSYALMRYTNDDYQTYSSWQNINLNAPKAQVSRNGQARRRAFDLLHADNVPLRLESLECVVETGDT